MFENAVKLGKFGGVQGDVPILAVSERSLNGKPTKQRIVAYGESTGHHHEIIGECEVIEVERSIEGQFFKGLEVIVTDKPVYLWHKSDGDHAPLEFTPGVWFIPTEEQQVEYDGENERRVID